MGKIISDVVKFNMILIILLISFIVFFWLLYDRTSIKISMQALGWSIVSEHSYGARNLYTPLSSLLFHLSGSWLLMSTTLTYVGLIPKNQWSDVS